MVDSRHPKITNSTLTREMGVWEVVLSYFMQKFALNVRRTLKFTVAVVNLCVILTPHLHHARSQTPFVRLSGLPGEAMTMTA